ncbi:MAG TPA: sugar phosphate isomerase/epimerase family protein [Bacteroidota bacterium]|mgnify:FL=1|nr:sugar phosphate isomerase/epimerase family protein [Bacteroidota bacterium]
MKIGFVSDEISPNIEIAINKCIEWNIDTLELRNLLTGRLPYVDKEEKEKLFKFVKKFNINISAISPGIFRYEYQDTEKLKLDFEKTLPDTIQLCERLNCKKIIIFGFRRKNLLDDTDLDNVINEFGKVAEIAAKYSINIAIENGYDSWCKESKRILRIFEILNCKNLGINWDPANAIADNEKPFPDTYEKIKSYITNLHVKDTKHNGNFTCLPIGEGNVDWEGQIKAILNDIPDINITIETHCEPLIINSKKNLEKLKEIINNILTKK